MWTIAKGFTEPLSECNPDRSWALRGWQLAPASVKEWWIGPRPEAMLHTIPQDHAGFVGIAPDRVLRPSIGPRLSTASPRQVTSRLQGHRKENHEELRKLGDRLDAVERRGTGRSKAAPPTSLGIAFRFSTEMVAALIVGGGIGYGIDWLAGSPKPICSSLCFSCWARRRASATCSTRPRN